MNNDKSDRELKEEAGAEWSRNQEKIRIGRDGLPTPPQEEPWVAEFHKAFTGTLYPELKSFIQKTLEADRKEIVAGIEGMRGDDTNGESFLNQTIDKIITKITKGEI